MSQEPKVLLVTDSVALPASLVLWVLQQFQHKLSEGSSLDIVTQASNVGGNLMLKACSLDAVISLAETTGFHTIEWLSEIAKALRPGGCLIVQEHMDARPSASHNIDPDVQVAATEAEADLERRILLAGFMQLTKSEILKDVESPQAFQITDSKPSLVPQPIMISAQKPAWEIGAVFEIKKPAISIRDEESVSPTALGIVLHSDHENTAKDLDFAAKDGAAILALATSEIDTESGFIDEDALLAEEDLDSRVPPAVSDDVEMGTSTARKACKNCTCGHAQKEENAKLTPEQLSNPKSACKNCGRGDAFRCNSCPYRGLPPFKLGEKIMLTGSLQTVDA